jgi:hypothetical protein
MREGVVTMGTRVDVPMRRLALWPQALTSTGLLAGPRSGMMCKPPEGKSAIGDWLTALVALLSLVALSRWNVSSPIVVAVTAIIGLIAFPLLQPTWVFVK